MFLTIGQSTDDILSPKDVNAVVYLTDSASEGLSNSLANFPLAIKVSVFPD